MKNASREEPNEKQHTNVDITIMDSIPDEEGHGAPPFGFIEVGLEMEDDEDDEIEMTGKHAPSGYVPSESRYPGSIPPLPFSRILLRFCLWVLIGFAISAYVIFIVVIASPQEVTVSSTVRHDPALVILPVGVPLFLVGVDLCWLLRGGSNDGQPLPVHGDDSTDLSSPV